MPNRLAQEKSPYLLQHAHNPVDWLPWGDQALALALELDKPIFLSIGYATCHWCHVMAHESFEDQEVAALLNEHFVPVKVDREERPDLDGVYMSVCQALTGSGGWPLTVFLTPQGRPFHAGTYYPKHSGLGRPGLMEILPQIARLWREQREKVLETSGHIIQAVNARPAGAGGELDDKVMEKAYYALEQAFDPKHGGFGKAPKFPTPHHLNFLLRWQIRQPPRRAGVMVEKTLDGMRAGGIFDHLGLGFARYSVDERWLAPHFEKMLYDQALLALAYLEAHQQSGETRHLQTAADIFTYVLRDMTHPQGGFFSAEDADSEGKEGLFYLWTPLQVNQVLGPELGDLFCRFYDIGPAGNFEHGMSIPHLTRSVEAFAQARGLEAAQVEADLAQARGLLFAAREGRVHPLKDDKILSAWNGLMIAALAKGHAVAGRPDWLQAAQAAARFILANLSDPQGRLLRRWRDGHTSGQGFLDDHAFFVWGLLELYQADQNPAWLEQALRLTALMERHFADELHGGYYYAAHDGEALFMREKDIYDGAMPSGNSVAAHNLLRLARLTGDPTWERKAMKLFKAFAGQVRQAPQAHTHLLCALDYALAPGREVVIAGDPADPRTQAMLRAALASFRPDLTLLLNSPGPAGERLRGLAPYTRGMDPVGGAPAAYVCQNHACQRPVTTVEELNALLASAETA